MSARRLLTLVAGAGALLAGRLGAQTPPTPGGQCDLILENTGNTAFTSSRIGATEQYITYIGQGVLARCRGQDVTLRADSAEHYGDQGVMYLIGNVHYVEPRVKVDSRRMTYWQNEARLLAEGSVVAVMPNGTTMRGPRAEYFRAIPNVRPLPRMVAPNRPTITIIEKDSVTGKPQPPVTVIANTVVMSGDSLIFASGNVDITRPDLKATADSAAMDSGKEWARLIRRPRIEGKSDRPFTLTGKVIDLWSKRRQLERVLSADSAHAVSQDLDLRSDTIDLRVQENRLQRAYVWGPSRARATSPDRDVSADSIEVVMPNQRVREMRAVRGAFAQTAPDSTRIRSKERDWLRGDTIVARFDSIPRSDSASKPKVREIVAHGAAQSFYQIPPADASMDRPSMNYVRGRQITVTFRDQQVNAVSVLDQAVGMYLEPTRDSTSAPAARAGTGSGAGRATTPPRTPQTTRPRPASPGRPRPPEGQNGREEKPR